MPLGETLEVLGEDPPITKEMPVYCFRAGERLLSIDRDPETGIIRCLIQKTARD